jgi:hypothetical protein
MSDSCESSGRIGLRLKLGVALFALSVVLPLAGVPAVFSLGLSVAVAATISGILIVVGEALGVVAVAIMGKPGYLLIKSRLLGFLGRRAPAGPVGPVRYRIGLVMFSLPLLLAWVYPYLAGTFGWPRAGLTLAVFGDVLLLGSLFVLGGGFWDKLRSLFVRDATSHFPRTARGSRHRTLPG